MPEIRATGIGSDWSGPYYRIDASVVVHVGERSGFTIADATKALLAAIREHEASEWDWKGRGWIVLDADGEEWALEHMDKAPA